MRVRATVPTVAALALVLGACGGQPSDRTQIRAVLERFAGSLVDERPGDACAMMTPRAQRELVALLVQHDRNSAVRAIFPTSDRQRELLRSVRIEAYLGRRSRRAAGPAT